MTDGPGAIVLAAGQGTRMNSDLPKVCHRCFGEPMIVHVLRSLRRSRVSGVTVVVGTGAQTVSSHLPSAASTVHQENQLGTGHAVECALDRGSFPDDQTIIVTCGDIPGVRPQTYTRLVETHRDRGEDVTILTVQREDPTGYGRIVTGKEGSVQRIVEENNATPDQQSIQEVNTGILCGPAGQFRELLPRVDVDEDSGEYYLTDIVAEVNATGGAVGSLMLEDSWQVTGINTRQTLVEFEREWYRRHNRELLNNGVTVHDPHRAKIGPWVEIARDVEIDGDVTMQGESSVGSGSRLSGECLLEHAALGKNCEVENATLRECELGDSVRVGPYCHVRPDTQVGDRVRLGNYVEIKNSTLGEDTNVAHLSYIGDADIGVSVNVGAGTITCNYDGVDKHRTVLEDEVFIGSNTELVAPVTVGEGAFVGAGSTITEDVPPHSLAVSRVEQTCHENWVKTVWEPRKQTEGDSS